MIKPNNFDNTPIAGDFTPIELGGHILVIKEVLETRSNTGRPMIKVSFDTADHDKQPHYFSDLYKNDTRQEKKWAANGCTYILTEDENGNCTKDFKTFISAVEKSNIGFAVQWGNGFSACFKNKFVGGVFGIVNDYYDRKALKKRNLRWFRSVENVNEANIPNEAETRAYKNWIASGGTPQNETSGDGFMNIPDGIDEELPFN